MSTTVTRQGSEFLVNTTTANTQSYSTVTGLTNGGFVVTWIDYSGQGGDADGASIKAQVFDTTGAKVGGELLVNTATANDQLTPTITGLTNGGFVVTWYDVSGQGGDADNTSIKAQVFDATGSRVGGEFLVNTATASAQYAPTITGLPNGRFVVTWFDYSGQGGDADASSIKAQVFDATGTRIGGEFLVNTTTQGYQYSPKITGLTNGGFVVTWNDTSGLGGDTDLGIKAQVFDATGSRVGGEFLVNTATANYQYLPTITGLTNGGFVVTWADYSGYSGQPGDPDIGIKAQVFDATGVRVGAEFPVNTVTANDQYLPTITGLTNGGFVVTWSDYSGQGGDASDGSVKAQVFDATGTRIGGEFLVNTATANSQFAPTITGLTNGGFVVTWTDASGYSGQGADQDVGIKAQIFDVVPDDSTWVPGRTGDWTVAANWVNGRVPDATSDVTVLDAGGSAVHVVGSVAARSVTVAANTVSPSKLTLENATLTTSGAVIIQGNDAEIGYTASELRFIGTSTLTAAGGLEIGIDARAYLGTDVDAGSATTHATIHGAVRDDGSVSVTKGSLVVDGAVSGTGRLSVDGGGSLEVTGAATVDAITLGQAKLTLDDAAHSTARVFVSNFTPAQTAAHTVIDLKNAASFGGSLWVEGRYSGIDLVGAASATLSGTDLHVVMSDGHALDLTTYLFPDYINGNTAPSKGIVTTASDGHGGLNLSFTSGYTRTWHAGAQGNASDPANWVGGVAPGALDDLVVVDDAATLGTGPGAHSLLYVDGASNTFNSLTADFSKGGSGGIVSINGTLNLAEALTVKASPNYTTTGSSSLELGTSVVNAQGVVLGKGTILTARDATVNAAMQFDGEAVLGGPPSQLTINGTVTGAGIFDVFHNATLTLNGASSALIYLDGGTAHLAQASAMTGRVVVGADAVSTLDLKGGSLGGDLEFFRGSTLDLVGIQADSATLDGAHLHLSGAGGTALDLDAYYFTSGSGPQSFDPTHYTLPSRVAPVVASDGHGGTLLSFVQGINQTWVSGDWSDPGAWQSGAVPRFVDGVTVSSGGVHTISSDVRAYDLSLGTNTAAIQIGAGSLTLSGALGLAGGSLSMAGATSLSADSVTVGRGGTISGYSTDFSKSGTATLHADVINDGSLLVGFNQHIVVDGALSGTGYALIDFGGILEITGIDSQRDILLRSGSTLVLDAGADATGRIHTSGGVSLDLSHANAFGGTIGFSGGPGSTVDLVGVTSASASAGLLHVTTKAGASFDVAFAFAPGTSNPTSLDPNFGLLVSDDGHGGTTVGVQSKVEHAPQAYPVSLVVRGDGFGNPNANNGGASLGGYDQDSDPLTLVSVGKHGSPAIPSNNGGALVQGQYGTLSVLGLGNLPSYSLGSQPTILGQHAVDVFDYTISDGRTGGTSTGTVSVTIERAPTAQNDAATIFGTGISRDAAHGVLANDSDPDGDAIFVSSVLGSDGQWTYGTGQTIAGQYGTLTLNRDGSYAYALTSSPPSGAHDTFTYAVRDDYFVFGENPSNAYDPNSDRTATLDLSFGASPHQPPSSVPGQGTPNSTKTLTDTDGSKIVARYDAKGAIASIQVTATDNTSDTFRYTNVDGQAVLTSETQLHADKSKDVFQSNLTGRTYVAEHDSYDAAGVLFEVTRTHTDTTLDYHYVLAANGTKTTDVYDSAGGQTSHTVVTADGTKDVVRTNITGQTYTAEQAIYAASGTLTSIERTHGDGTKAYAYSYDVISGTKTTDSYDAAGTQTSHTVVTADGAKDVFRTNITGQTYTAEHDIYAASGTLTGIERTHGDGSKAYAYSYDPAGGTKTTDLYDATGVQTFHTVVAAGGAKEVFRTNITGQSYTAEHDTYAASGTLIGIERTHSDGTKAYAYSYDPAGGTKTTDLYDATGVQTFHTVAAADGAKDVFRTNIIGQTYTAEHDIYAAGGALQVVDRTNLDGSHSQAAYQAGVTLVSTASVVDQFRSVGGDSFVFARGFGKDVISGFHSGSDPTHDILVLDQSQVASFADLRSHMTAAGHDTLIALSPTDTILLKNVSVSSLAAVDFHFQDHGLFHV